jgi:hypothetical protein
VARTAASSSSTRVFARRPAGFDVGLGHALVVAPEEGQEVLRQVILVEVVQGADDAEVERDVAAEGLGLDRHQDVPGVHIGVEEAVAEHLGEEDLDAIARQFFQVDAGGNQAVGLRDRDAVHALHHDHAAGAVIPVHLRHHQQVRAGEVAAQLAGLGRLAHQVEFVVQVFVELGHDFARLQAAAVGPHPFDQAGGHLHQRQVFVDRASSCRDAAP